MDNKEFATSLERRTKAFAIGIIRLSAALPNSPEAKVIRNQVTKSATSIGANYREVNRARSRADFTNKIRICESEASETQYWLEIISEMEWLPNGQMEAYLKECGELVAIFTSIAKR